jgi:N-carbamoylputrescine amidase
MALMGAEILLYPTAIGSEPLNPSYDSQPHWQTCMQGHRRQPDAGCRLEPHRHRNHRRSTLTFYGSSFITDNKGALVARCDRRSRGVIVADFDLEACAAERAAWGLFRDRRPAAYRPLMTLDGETRS